MVAIKKYTTSVEGSNGNLIFKKVYKLIVIFSKVGGEIYCLKKSEINMQFKYL